MKGILNQSPIFEKKSAYAYSPIFEKKSAFFRLTPWSHVSTLNQRRDAKVRLRLVPTQSDFHHIQIHTHPKYGNQCLAKFYWKNNGRNEIFEKKMHGKEVSHDRVKPLLG